MQLNINTSMRPEMRQEISPRMIQSMEILQLPVMALQERIEHELEENPFLELREAGAENEDGAMKDAEVAEIIEPPPQSLQDHLNDQLAYLDDDVVNIDLIRYMISHLDERGYLTTPLEDIRQYYG